MTAVHWLTAINGSFTNAADWSGGMVPGASDDAILDAVGSSPYTVSSSVNETVQSIQTGSNAMLDVNAGMFIASSGTGSGSNAGIILVGAGATLVTGGVVTNTGTIELDGASGTDNATLLFDRYTTLTGGGELLLGGNAMAGSLYRKNKPVGIINVDNTIVGSGEIAKPLFLYNGLNGTIDANSSAPFLIRGNVENAGLIEMTGGGQITLDTAYLGNDSTGTILVGGKSKLLLKEDKITGGTIVSVGSGIILAHNCYFGTNSHSNTMTIDANIDIFDSGQLANNIVNNGTISLALGNIAIPTSLTLTGNGVVDLAGGEIFDNGGEDLTLASGTIRGSGYVLGPISQPIQLSVGTAGVIDGDAAASLTLATKSRDIINAGTIESTGAGGVVVEDAIVNTGTLIVAGGGTFEAESSVKGAGSAIIDGGTMKFLSSVSETVNFTGSGTLLLSQSQQFKRSINGFSVNGETTLDLADIDFVDAGEATFSGTSSSGVLTVTDGTHTANIMLKGNYLSSNFIASSDGDGGVNVVAQVAMIPAASTHALVSAMAALGPSAGGGAHTSEAWPFRDAVLTSPRVALS